MSMMPIGGFTLIGQVGWISWISWIIGGFILSGLVGWIIQLDWLDQLNQLEWRIS